MPLAQPARVVALDLVAVLDREIDGLEAVVGIVEVVVGVVAPFARRSPGRSGRRPAGAAPRRCRAADQRRAAGHVLQVRLADQRGAVAGLAQQVDEGHGFERQRNAVVAHAMQRRRPPGHQRRRGSACRSRT